MPIVNPTLAQIEAFERDTPDAKPIVMVNLLKFRERADYGQGGTGREAYARYSKAVMPLLWEVGGQPLWMGKGRAPVIAPDGESWDEVLLVHYPSRRAFLRMVKSEPYQAIMHHRTAALADARLIETRAMPLPRWLLGAARQLLRLKTLVFPKIA
jgi:uncharacterized protein (DUF1330 family)